MVEIQFSIMENNPGDVEQLRSLAQTFEEKHHIHVHLIGIPWEHGWNEISKFGIYGRGPDVSSVGSTWIGSLAGMNALRKFTAVNIEALGGAETFFQSAWRSGFLSHDDSSLWAVPWFGDAMMIYFWEEMLEEAGIYDFQAAFASDEALLDTLRKLQDSGVTHPLVLNVVRTNLLLHEAAHWIWNAGGDFVNSVGDRVIFNQPAALEGFKKYFGLQPFISPKLFNKIMIGNSINQEGSAICFAGPWLTDTLKQSHWEDKRRRPGVLPVPGVGFTGGASLVIWQYTPHAYEATEWVRFLATQPVRGPSDEYRNQVPTRREALQVPLQKDDFLHRVYAQYLQSMQRGRTFPTMRLWGTVESVLMGGITDIWQELFENPTLDLDECLHRTLDPLARRLNDKLGN